MSLDIPALCLVVMVGATGSGKSTFARRHFKATEIVASDACRALVSDDENDQSATNAAFEVLHTIARKRLERGLLTVVDATNVEPASRKSLVALAKEHHVFAVAIVLDVPDTVCIARNQARTDRQLGAHVVRGHQSSLRRGLRHLKEEGFRYVHVLRDPEAVDAAEVVRTRLWVDRKDDHGPFDLIGDVHGCYDELVALLTDLGWSVDGVRATPPEGRKAVFVGDLVDRGPRSDLVLELVMNLVEAGHALCVGGNHEAKLGRHLNGKGVKLTHGLAETVASFEGRPPEFLARVGRFVDGLISHYVLDGGKLVVAHAGLKETMHGRTSGAVRSFAMYGDTTGEIDEYGLPVRIDWAQDYRGRASVVYGHVPVVEAEWLNHTIDIDTGCCFGGRLTALRWPEKELVQFPAAREYYAPSRPLAPPIAERSAQHAADDDLDLADVTGRRHVHTRLGGNVTVREPNAAAALEAMSRWAMDPRWLVYLPPTMSPPETTSREGLLEHPDEAFGYYRGNGVAEVICEEKHMGSRAVIAVCRDAEAARRRFGVTTGEGGVIWTRTGRRFFEDAVTEAAIVGRLREALDQTGLWEQLGTDWALIDAELLPWSAKAQELLRSQYAAVGTAAGAALSRVNEVLGMALARGQDVGALAARQQERSGLVGLYVDAYRRYCWPVASAEDLVVAPFHLLATEGAVHADKDHVWHMELLGRLAGPGIRATPWRRVRLDDESAVKDAVSWWEALVGAGGEGMVVKPLAFVARGKRGILQPAVKCRGPEYLRIIYGPEYSVPENLERLRQRGVSAKRSLAVREFALGIEALERFVRREPLRRVHEAVFAVLAMESEPVDPRL